MKKKIGDFTLREIFGIGCSKCPLNNYCHDAEHRSLCVEFNDYTDLNKEIDTKE